MKKWNLYVYIFFLSFKYFSVIQNQRGIEKSGAATACCTRSAAPDIYTYISTPYVLICHQILNQLKKHIKHREFKQLENYFQFGTNPNSEEHSDMSCFGANAERKYVNNE